MNPTDSLPTWAWLGALGALSSVVGILFKMANGHAAARIDDKDAQIAGLVEEVERRDTLIDRLVEINAQQTAALAKERQP